jgi:hypothetical protein
LKDLFEKLPDGQHFSQIESRSIYESSGGVSGIIYEQSLLGGPASQRIIAADV